MKRILIKEATLVNEQQIRVADVLIEDQRIARIDSRLAPGGNYTEINASGLHLLPGVIDDQVHFREPGMTHKATIYSESKAGIAGGVTTFMEQPNTFPPAVTQELLELKYNTGRDTSLANYSFFLGTTNNNLEEIKRADPERICGIKIFMGSSTGDLAITNEQSLEDLFRFAPTLIATHCETDSIIKANAAVFRKEYGDQIPIRFHPEIRSVENCVVSTRKAISLAQKHQSRLHVFHISTAEEVDLFSNQLPSAKKSITAEACVHHLWFSADDYERLGSLIKCNPAIKAPHHRDRILQGVINGHIDVLATDHAPHTWEEKQQTDYFKNPSGLPLLQYSLPMMVELYHQGKISLEMVVQKMCHSVADCFRIRDRGYIREGYYADLVLMNLNDPMVVDKAGVLYKCGWSPLEGTSLQSRVTHTFVNGNLVYCQGQFDESTNGMRLSFHPLH